MANERGADGNDETNGTEITTEHTNRPRWWLFYQNNPIVGLTGWIAVFSLVLAVTGVLQFLAYIQSQRAFVAAATTNFATELVPGTTYLSMFLGFQNSGRSTAFVKELSVAITHNLTPEPQYFQTRKIAFPPVVAGGVSRRASKFETGWSQETIDKITSGALNFYIYGVIKYTDGYNIFGPSITGFCFAYVPSVSGNTAAFETCEEPAYTYTK